MPRSKVMVAVLGLLALASAAAQAGGGRAKPATAAPARPSTATTDGAPAAANHGSNDAARAEAPGPDAAPDAAPAPPDDAFPPDVPVVRGPARVAVGPHVELHLPVGMQLVTGDAARTLLTSAGEGADGVVGLIAIPGHSWMVKLMYQDLGHVDDTDGGQLDADALMRSIRDGTRAQNLERARKGTPELTIDDWTERPHYVRDRHQLAWGLAVHDSTGPAVNVSIHVLGRTGDVQALVIDAPETIVAARAEAQPILDGVWFDRGWRYEDFDPDTDHDSGLGLTGLVVGGVVVAHGVKTGFFITLLLVLKKAFIVVAAAFAAFFRRIRGWFRRPARTGDAPAAPVAPAEPASPPPDDSI